MPSASIEDLANILIEKLSSDKNIKIVEIGPKPGEKLFEELINDEEIRRTCDIGDFLLIQPIFNFTEKDKTESVEMSSVLYRSDLIEKMKFTELRKILDQFTVPVKQ